MAKQMWGKNKLVTNVTIVANVTNCSCLKFSRVLYIIKILSTKGFCIYLFYYMKIYILDI